MNNEEKAREIAFSLVESVHDTVWTDCYCASLDMAEWKDEQYCKERLSHCENLTKEQYERESQFVSSFIKKYNRAPTIIDAIEVTESEIKEIIKRALLDELETVNTYNHMGLHCDAAYMIKRIKDRLI